eukprot:TRINITY_DN8035_c0_g1_i1.p1 TRINITY_DN8035_c0_g1~~TRINITY_DN8035_c0_g1_i1.p1  ORF type:complete len:423 (+),score=30.40 TRINITY_DN8035_c0_g1_i1:159-1427(+)
MMAPTGAHPHPSADRAFDSHLFGHRHGPASMLGEAGAKPHLATSGKFGGQRNALQDYSRYRQVGNYTGLPGGLASVTAEVDGRHRLAGTAGRRPAYPPPPPATHLPSAPPAPHHLVGSSHSVHSSHHGSHHGSAGSRSLPPGSRASRRPPTPTTTVGAASVARRDDGASSLHSRGSHGSALDGSAARDLQGSERSVRSRSVAAAGSNGVGRWAGGEAPSLSAGGSTSSSSGNETCDKCDGKHSTDRCPHFRGAREKHKDAWVNYGRKSPHQMGASGGNHVIRSARVIRQPGDGSCLFHSLCHGLASGSSATSLRREIANFLKENPSLEIAGDTIEEWVRWDANSSVADYARRMATSGWGGGIEMAACSLLKHVNVHVYESASRGCGGEFKRISCFDCPNANRTIHVLYQGGVHYDALVPLTA